MENYGHFFNGKLVNGSSSNKLPVHCSYNGELIGKVDIATSQEIENVVSSAKNAFKTWSLTTPNQRSQIFFKLRELLKQHTDELAIILTKEHGKVFLDAKGEIIRGIEVIEFLCGMPSHLRTPFSAMVSSNMDSHELSYPLGVCLGITPFNFPCMVPLWMFPVAIAAGNTFILKPSEQDPGCPLLMAKLMTEAGFPNGVFNVINGDKDTVQSLIKHPDIAAVSFVGSTPVAKSIYNLGSSHGKRVQALGGAKNHVVVMPDAILKQGVAGLMGAAYGSAGERCMAISVAVVVGDEIGDKLIAELTPLVQNLKIGPGFDKDNKNEMGALISEAHMKRVKNYIDIGVKEGAKLVVDGRNFKHPDYANGFFVGGTLFDKVKPEMVIYKEEIFGPVLSVVRVKSLDEAIQLINQHEFGNGAAIFTRDGHSANQFVNRISVGMVGVNVPLPVPVAQFSFGGWKNSSFSPSGVYGHHGLKFYTKTKTVTSRWEPDEKSISKFNFPTND